MHIQLVPYTSQYQPEALRLYEFSFPSAERRDSAQWLAYCDNPPAHFCPLVALDAQGQFVGFITLWQFHAAIYVEHFAVDSSRRGEGIGSAILQALSSRHSLPLLLEVEPPLTSEAVRRIAFYERHGFSLLSRPYRQPPYAAGGEWITLLLMAKAFDLSSEALEETIADIYRHVYHCSSSSSHPSPSPSL